MSEWFRVLIGALVTAVGVYVTIATDVNDHSRRLDRLDRWAESHIEKHDAQLEKIDGRLSRMELILAALKGTDLTASRVTNAK